MAIRYLLLIFLRPYQFLAQLPQLFSSAKSSGSVYITLKKCKLLFSINLHLFLLKKMNLGLLKHDVKYKLFENALMYYNDNSVYKKQMFFGWTCSVISCASYSVKEVSINSSLLPVCQVMDIQGLISFR